MEERPIAEWAKEVEEDAVDEYLYDQKKEMDEDLIPAYTCAKCHRKVCKDEVSKRLDSGSFDCICIYCDTEVE